MGFVDAIKSGFRNYVNFRTRACRSEFWYFFLFIFLVNAAIGIIEGGGATGGEVGLLGTIFSLAIILPSLAVSVRRLHDIDRSGWWLLIWFIPIVGFVVILVWACKRGTLGDNRFGPDPLSPAVADATF